jgi:hypothetical protein
MQGRQNAVRIARAGKMEEKTFLKKAAAVAVAAATSPTGVD